MSDKQKEAAGAGVMGSRFEKIAAVFDTMPERFKMFDLMRKAGIKDSPQVRSVMGSILARDFKCINVCTSSGRFWKKPSIDV